MSRRRPGYTLLEVMLAIAIGLLIVAALYVAMDVQFRYMNTGRNLVVEGQLARGILNQMNRDIRVSLAVLPGRLTTTTASSTASATTDANGQPTTDPNQEQPTGTAVGTFNLGLRGDDRQIELFVSTLPRYSLEDEGVQTGLSDLRRIRYWLEPGRGLVRQEVRNVMAGELQAEEGPTDVIAGEVTELQFRYYDPVLVDWVASWDGSTNGPPLAVEITISVLAQTTNVSGPPREPTLYRMVVGVPSAFIPAEAVSTTTGGMP